MGRMRRCFQGGFAAALLLTGCGGADDGTGTTGAAGPTISTVESSVPVETATSQVETSSEPETTSTVPVDDPTTEPSVEDTASEVDLEPAMDSVDAFIASWAQVVRAFPEARDLVPTISSADVELDPTVDVDAFVEQASPSTVIGGIADPDSGAVTGLMGLSDPDSDHTAVMIEVVWTGAFGSDERDVLSEYFPPDVLQNLGIGEQVTRVHNDKSIVLSHVDGATPDDGVFVFTIGDEQLLEEDPAHDSIINVVLGLLVRTS